jgi:hypothetical protein
MCKQIRTCPFGSNSSVKDSGDFSRIATKSKLQFATWRVTCRTDFAFNVLQGVVNEPLGLAKYRRRDVPGGARSAGRRMRGGARPWYLEG